ncbi:uracil-DNA glycosylase [Batrachochytrium dendrobatidis JEL423]|uniref:Uracil-DNA glycosylase n=1 Tax=Batrachochytrium dendrobatidis (strain JEL423) TaxID=403673 RepID=A0A177WDM1_BATDL|nr:uracil-DNA glycosylase [Batrachochytrium dendrobatidis JEL423]
MYITDYFKKDPAKPLNTETKLDAGVDSVDTKPNTSMTITKKRTDPPRLESDAKIRRLTDSENINPSDTEKVTADDTVLANKLSETQPLLQLEITTMPDDWFNAFRSEMESAYFLNIKRFLQAERDAKKPCELTMADYPYHGLHQAHGQCFSVQKGVSIPPSLINIYKELESDLGLDVFKRPSHGYLNSWCQQGVLLLNASLTVRQSEPNSHAKCGWLKFTDAIIAYINKNNQGVVFMLWGGFAQKKGTVVDKKKHLVLKATHPSPLGANKGGWFGCKHFSKANEYLKSKGRGVVDWASITRD